MARKKSFIKRRTVKPYFTEIETVRGNVWVCHYNKGVGWVISRNGSIMKSFKLKGKANRVMMGMARNNG